ncbi:MAG: hypothetical protein HFJ12_05600 [Bacilli bacterium]|nr:hypothetical protein [Bacilli bacterium]
MSNKKEEYVKLKQKINQIIPIIKDSRKKYKEALGKLEKGAISNGKTMDSGLIKEIIEKEEKMIKKLNNILDEISEI